MDMNIVIIFLIILVVACEFYLLSLCIDNIENVIVHWNVLKKYPLIIIGNVSATIVSVLSISYCIFVLSKCFQ